MSDANTISKGIAAKLMQTGCVVARAASGQRLFLMTTEFIGEDEPGLAGEKGIMVALEGGGCFLWDGLRELNAFRLISSGFDLATAATLAEVLNEIHTTLRNPGAAKHWDMPVLETSRAPAKENP